MANDELIIEDDPVFILRGKDDEIYMIDDPMMIKKLESIFEQHNEIEALQIALPMLNPKKYK